MPRSLPSSVSMHEQLFHFANSIVTNCMETEHLTKLTYKGLLCKHKTKENKWGLIVVHSGTLKYEIYNSAGSEVIETILLQAGGLPNGVIEPQVYHKVTLLTASTSFRIEFYGKDGVSPPTFLKEVEATTLNTRSKISPVFLLLSLLIIFLGVAIHFQISPSPTPLPPLLPPIPRFDEAEFSTDDFKIQCIDAQIPCIIKRSVDKQQPKSQSQSQSQSQSPCALVISLLKACGSNKVNLLSPTVHTFLDVNMNKFQRQILSWLMSATFGLTLDEWVRQRAEVSLDDFYANSLIAAPPPPNPPSIVFKKYLKYLMPQTFKVILKLVGRPPYLADIEPDLICPGNLFQYPTTTKYEDHVQTLLDSR